MPQISIIVIILFGFLPHYIILQTVLDVAIHNMIHEITQTYFIEFPCIVFISEKMEPLSDVDIHEVPIMRIITDTLDIEDSSSTDTFALRETAQLFERLLEKTLDAGCLGYVVQTTNTKAIIHSFKRAVMRTVQRAQRNYLFLPSVKTEDMDVFAQEVLSMRELELMPNILIAKIHTNIPLPLFLEETVRLKYRCTDSSPQLQGRKYHRTGDALFQDRKFIENISLTFRNMNHKHPATKQYDTNNMVLTIEIVSQSFVGLNPSEEVSLDFWVQYGPEGYFALCADLYPDKTVDLQGKPITAIYIPYDPYVVIYDMDGQPTRDGIEYLIFRELVKKLNGTADEFLDLDNSWGAIFENGTGNGIVGSVLNGNADSGFAAVYSEWHNEWRWIDFTYPYCQSAAVLVVPRPKLIPGYLVPLLPFSSPMWAAVLLSFAGISFCVYLFSAVLHKVLPGFNKERITLGRSFFDTLGMFVLQVPNEESEKWQFSPWKHFMTWLFLYFILITAMYNGGLASILTVPLYEPPMDTLAELAASDLNWSFPHDAAIWAFRYTDDPTLKTIANKYVWMSNEDLELTALSADTGILVEQLSGGVFSYGPYMTTKAMAGLKLMKEPFYCGHVVLTTRKSGPYTQKLNNMILLINQGGLGIYWQADVVRRFLSSYLQLLIALSLNENDPDGGIPRTLELYHLEGAFFLLTLGLVTSAAVFVLELLADRCKKICQNAACKFNIKYRMK